MIYTVVLFAALSYAQTDWQQISGFWGGDIRTIAVDPNNQCYYAGTSNNGVFYSEENHTSWIQH
ncbi:MAG: hypothetical protein GF353_22980, partial [Candidatus Lokiarchaeota archaeon]|nr:hypothetical protein [Candidatus Lokiarchaeota archaeon]